MAEKVIRTKEREKCEFDLKSQPLIANVKEVTLEINFLNVTHKLIYFPVYYAVSFISPPFFFLFLFCFYCCPLILFIHINMVKAPTCGCAVELQEEHRVTGPMG